MENCLINICENSVLSSKPLDVKNGLPACSLEDEELVNNGEMPVKDKSRCCYLASVTRCRVTKVQQTEIVLENGDVCKLPDGQSIEQTSCGGGCSSMSSVGGGDAINVSFVELNFVFLFIILNMLCIVNILPIYKFGDYYNTHRNNSECL